MKLLKSFTISAFSLLLVANSSHSFEVISAQDLEKESGNRHATLNQTIKAENSFLNKLTNDVGTESFESFIWGRSDNINLSFPGAGTATLTGNGRVYSIEHTEGVTNQSIIEHELLRGRYASSGINYWQVRADVDTESTFTINFSQDIAAFGFYAYDLGDFGGELVIQLVKDGVVVGNIDNATYQLYNLHNSGSSTGSAIYVGIVGEKLGTDDYETFDQVRFTIANDDGSKYDEFAFDDMTIANAEQIINTNQPEIDVPNTPDSPESSLFPD